MKDNAISYTISGYSNETKAVSGFSLLVNRVFENFRNFTTRILDERSEIKSQINRKPQVKQPCHQNTDKQMPLERLIRTGYYPF